MVGPPFFSARVGLIITKVDIRTTFEDSIFRCRFSVCIEVVDGQRKNTKVAGIRNPEHEVLKQAHFQQLSNLQGSADEEKV